MSSTGKKFAEEFLQIGEVKLEDKVLIQDSEDGLVKYALVDQFNAAAHKEFEDFLKGEDADEIINKWSELEKFLAGLKETDDLATILSEKFNTKDFTKEKIKETLGIYDWALEETPPSGTGADFPLTYDAERDAWELKGNLVITKGLATYTKLTGFTNLDVMGGIVVDDETIAIVDGALKVIGGTGGGLDESALADYLTTNKYATQTWVTNQKYFTQANFTKSNIKSTLGISDWALEALKPSYEWSEIGSKPTTIAGYRITDAYTKTEVEDNFLAIDGIAVGAVALKQTATSSSYLVAAGNGFNVMNPWNTRTCWFGYGLPTGSAYATTNWRFGSSDGTGVASGNIHCGSVSIGGAKITYDSTKNAIILPTNVVIEGGLATYTKIEGWEDYGIMDAIEVDGTSIIKENGVLKAVGGGGGGDVSITGAASTIVTSNLTASRALISNSSGKVAVSAVTSTELGYLDGVTSKIQTQLNNKQATLVSGTNIKTINGSSILGSGNITISGGSASYDEIVPSVNATSDTGYSVGEEYYTYRYGYFNNIQARKAYAIRFYTAESSSGTAYERLRVGAGGKVTVAYTSDSYVREIFNVMGNIYTTGTVTESSARKMKNVEYEGDGLALTELKKIKVAKWHWKDKRDDKMHIGAIAEDLAEILPEVVFDSAGEDGAASPAIAYGKAGFSVAASLIAPVANHEDRIAELEKEIEKLKKKKA